MNRSFKKSFFIFLTLLTLAFSLLGVAPAYADDSAPPQPSGEVDQPVDQPPVEESLDTEGEVEQPAEAEEPVAEEEPTTVEDPAEAGEQAPIPAAEVPSIVEVMEQLPEDTALIVLDENGETLPLATEQAAETLAAPDPYFTVGGTIYQFSAADCDPGAAGDQACSTPIQAAINYLAGLDATPDDNTVYVEAGTYNEDIEIDGLWWTALGDLFLSGAGSGSTTVAGSLWAYNLSNDFILSGFSFTDDLYVNADGDVELNDVSVDGAGADGGLYVSSGGDVTLEDVTSVHSSADGAYVEADGNVDINNSVFEENSDSGLSAASFSGNITLDGVTASENGIDGAWLNASYGDITVTDSAFQDNAEVGLLSASAGNSITLSGVTAGGNGYFGAWIFTAGDVLIENSVFGDNGIAGLLSYSSSGGVVMNEVTASGNGDAGAVLISNTQVDIFCSEFSSNEIGILGITPVLSLNGVAFSGNTEDYENIGGNVSVSESCDGGSGGNGNGGGDSGDRSRGKEQIVLFIVIPQTRDLLPAPLVEGSVFGSALKVVLTEQGAALDSLTIPLFFPVPEGMQSIELAVMSWTGSAWEEVTGGSVVDEIFVITVNQPGFYVLVGR